MPVAQMRLINEHIGAGQGILDRTLEVECDSAVGGVIAQEDAQHLSHPQGLNDVIDNDLLFELHQARTTHDRSEYKI